MLLVRSADFRFFCMPMAGLSSALGPRKWIFVIWFENFGVLCRYLTIFFHISQYFAVFRSISQNFVSFRFVSSIIISPVFYLLPKIHKEGIPGRPILSGCGSPTEKLSSYLDHYLRPIVEESASYIKDTTHFLQQIFEIHTSIPPNSWLVTLDVKSLYTNIPQEEGIEACLEAIRNYYGDTPPLHTSYIKQMMVFILKHNYFTFNGRFYQQIQGTAMGSPFAPNYANIFMTTIEQHILHNAPMGRTPMFWKRFIDDIIFIWPHTLEDLQNFIQYTNTVHKTIKFEANYSNTNIHFLDTTINLHKEGGITTSLYQKPTDTCNLLHGDSFHPWSCKTGIIYSQALRYRRVITSDEELYSKLQELKNNLIIRGYQINDINEQFNKVIRLSQSQLLESKQINNGSFSTTKGSVLPFIIPYDNRTIHIREILKKHWTIITKDKELQNIWSKTPILALQRHNNLGDWLTHTIFWASYDIVRCLYTTPSTLLLCHTQLQCFFYSRFICINRISQFYNHLSKHAIYFHIQRMIHASMATIYIFYIHCYNKLTHLCWHHPWTQGWGGTQV